MYSQLRYSERELPIRPLRDDERKIYETSCLLRAYVTFITAVTHVVVVVFKNDDEVVYGIICKTWQLKIFD